MIDVSGLTVRFGGVTPLDGMDVKFEAGTCGSGVASGPNAAATASAFDSPVARNTICFALAIAGSVLDPTDFLVSAIWIVAALAAILVLILVLLRRRHN